VGYGCTSCIGNSGPLPDRGRQGDQRRHDLVVSLGAVGQPQLRGPRQPANPSANYLASPMLVVAYALAGSMKIDISKDPIGTGKKRQARCSCKRPLADEHGESPKAVDKCVTAKAMFKKRSTPTCSKATPSSGSSIKTGSRA
jgi:aconitate hydratase